MVRGVWLVALGATLLGCGGLDGPVYSSTARAFAASEAPAHDPGDPSDCESAAACEAECRAGTVSACTSWAEEVYPDDAEAAQRIWLDACKQRDGRACARLMQTATDDLTLADRFGEHACAYGYANACLMLANEARIRALTASGDDAERWNQRAVAYDSRAGAIAASLFVRDEPSKDTAPSKKTHEVLTEHRRGGPGEVRPDRAIRREMKRQRIGQLRADVKVCLSRIGTVENLEFLESSESPRWDHQIFDAMRAWRYSPFLIDGRAVPVCTHARFVFQFGAPPPERVRPPVDLNCFGTER